MSRAYARALGYLTARNRTIKETSEYLHRKGFSSAEIEETIAKLVDLDLLNDLRTAELWIAYCIRANPRGKKRISYDLQKRGVPREVVESVLAELDLTVELEMAKKLLSSRRSEEWSQEKIYRFLSYRGFSSSVIQVTVAGCENLT